MCRFLDRESDILHANNRSMLHIAPEICLVPKLKRLASDRYVTADLIREDVDIQLDIQSLPFPDEHFDSVYCSHVLQAVEDDAQSLGEIYRVLAPQGWAVVNVPERGEKTKDLRLGGEGERPPDFVRVYGSDFEEMLKSKGFDVQRVSVNDLYSDEEQKRYRVDPETAGAIFLVRK